MNQQTSALERLKARSPYGWLRERDIDLLMCAELHAMRRLAAYLSERCGFGNASLEGAWVSHADAVGESDLVAVFTAGERYNLALVENKIGAGFQPDQGARYLERARNWQLFEEINDVATVLFAPQDYLSKPGAEIFDVRLSFEAVCETLGNACDPRSAFFSETLATGIENFRRGYVMNPDATVTDIWHVMWQIAEDVAPRLRFVQPGAKPGRSTWVYFYNADGFADIDWRTAVVAYKADLGQADLQFGSTMSPALAEATTGLLDPGMKVVKAGKSASIRMEVPRVNFSATDDQGAAIATGLEVCEHLRSFFVTHRDRLMTSLGANSID